MALITCPECGSDVSSLADSCPKCGYPVRKMEEEEQEMEDMAELLGDMMRGV